MTARMQRQTVLWLAAALAASVLTQSVARAEQHHVIFAKVHGTKLEGNLLGDSPDRKVTIYLPAEYDQAPEKRFPVVYLLHGFTGSSLLWTGGGYVGEELHMAYLADEATASGRSKGLILVAPDCRNKYLGCWYENSCVTGGWEDFVTKELVAYIDGNYRTLASRDSRGIAGHSMGGHGAMTLAMDHPDVYCAVYAMSPAWMSWRHDVLETHKDQYRSLAARGTTVNFAEEEWRTQAMIALAAAVTPNPATQPFLADFPLDSKGEPVVATWEKWLSYDPCTMVSSHQEKLRELRAIRLDSGRADEVFESTGLFCAALKDAGIAHTFDEYDGDHTNRVAERLRDKVLPFFSETLKFE